MAAVTGTAMRALFISLVLLARYQDVPQNGSIHGRVVRVGTSEPLTKAFVELIGADAGPINGLAFFNPTPANVAARRTSISTRTNGLGEFSFADIPPGRYRLTAARDSYTRTEYLQHGNNDRGAVLEVADGQTLQDIDIEMTPAGTIAGAVRDEADRPIGHISISAYVVHHVPGGERRLQFVQSAETNDLGEYRLYWLTPGAYYIAANYGYGHDVTTVIRQNLVEPNVRYPTHYHPNALDPAHAQAVEVREGLIVEGIDFTLKHVPLPTLRGTVVSAPGATVSTRVELTPTLLPEQSESFASRVHPDGGFEITNVPMGQYLLSAGQSVLTVDVGASGVEELNVTLAPTVPVQGRIRTETGEALPGDLPAAVWFLGPHATRDGFQAEVGEAGTFTARGWPGEFEVS